MRKNAMKKFMSLFLCVVLTAALALAGCGKAEPAPAETTAAPAVTEAAPAETTAAEEAAVLGEGALSFQFVYEDLEGKQTKYEIHTDK